MWSIQQWVKGRTQVGLPRVWEMSCLGLIQFAPRPNRVFKIIYIPQNFQQKPLKIGLPSNLPQKFDKGVYVFQSHPVLGVKPTNSLAVFLSGRVFSFFHRFLEGPFFGNCLGPLIYLLWKSSCYQPDNPTSQPGFECAKFGQHSVELCQVASLWGGVVISRLFLSILFGWWLRCISKGTKFTYIQWGSNFMQMYANVILSDLPEARVHWWVGNIMKSIYRGRITHELYYTHSKGHL